MWVANSGEQSVSRIDPLTNRVVATIPLEQFATHLATGEAAVWAAGGSTLMRLDPSTNRSVETFELGAAWVDGLAVGETAIWVPEPIAPSITFKADAPALSRPILHLGREFKNGKPWFVSTGVYADGRSVERVTDDIGATWSPDGRWVAFSQGGRRLNIKSVTDETSTIYETRNNETIFPWPIWSPSGRDIAVVVSRPQQKGYALSSLVVIDVTTKKVRRSIRLSEETVHLPFFFTMPDKLSWSPTGRKILVSWENAVVVDADSGQVETISATPVIAEWTPEGDAVYYFQIENRAILGNFHVRRLDTRSPVLLMERARLANVGLKFGSIGGGRLALSPSGSKLAIATGSTKGRLSSLTIYEVKKGETIALDRPVHSFQTQEVLTALEWAPGENSVAVLEMSVGRSVAQDPASSPVMTNCVIKMLNINTGEWNFLANVAIESSEFEVLGLKTLSWTR